VGLKHVLHLILSENADFSFHCCVVHVGSGLYKYDKQAEGSTC